ncbi:MAG: DUF354 domain-containing protein [Candidatus Methanoperedens sp.]|nr:DUF354 domain-containing protein [Candidatus Methanoperedens sp.]
MKILFLVGHPAHVHLFKNLIRILLEKGHKIKIVAIEKEITLRLLDIYSFNYHTIGSSNDNMLAKLVGLFRKNYNLFKIAKGFSPDITISTGSPYLAQISKILNIPHIAFGDTEIAKISTRLMLPFTRAVCTPSCFFINLGPKQVRYEGYHELAYLHPNYFVPDPSVLDLLNCKDEKFFLLRISSLNASHDIGARGFSFNSDDQMLVFLETLEKYGRVFLTSERELDSRFEKYLIKIPIEKIHDLLYYATIYIGDGATMASEAGVLGTPWVYISNTRRGYLEDQELNYGLGYTFSDVIKATEKINELLNKNDLKREWNAKRKKLLNEKIDVTKFMVDFIENFYQNNQKSALSK